MQLGRGRERVIESERQYKRTVFVEQKSNQSSGNCTTHLVFILNGFQCYSNIEYEENNKENYHNQDCQSENIELYYFDVTCFGKYT